MEKQPLKILDLSLKYQWYDMIERGEKKEEYRELKPFYRDRFYRIGWKDGPDEDNEGIFSINVNKVRYDAVRFHRGQGGKQTMLWECKGITIGIGKPEWGAPEGNVFIIKLGNRL